MTALDRLLENIGKQGLVAVGFVLLVALAGCSGMGGSGTESPADTATPGDDGLPDTDTIVERTAATLEAVDSYESNSTLTSTIQVPNGEQTSNLTTNARTNRETRRLMVTQTVTALGQEITSRTYLLKDTIYRNNPRLAQQYGSEWVTVDASENQTQRWHRNDELMSHRVILENGSVTLAGTETIDGSEAYRLVVDGDEDALEAFYGYENTPLEITNVSTTMWVDTDTDRILQVDGRINQSVTTQGTTRTTITEYDLRFTYTDVSITLPEAADSAVDLNQTS